MMKCYNDDCTMAVHICCEHTPGSQVATDCEGDMSWLCDTCFHSPIPGLTGSSRLDAIVAAGGSRTKRKAPVLEYDDRPSLAGVGGHWREQMAAGGNGKESMDIDNTDMPQAVGGKGKEPLDADVTMDQEQITKHQDETLMGKDAAEPSPQEQPSLRRTRGPKTPKRNPVQLSHDGKTSGQREFDRLHGAFRTKSAAAAKKPLI